MTRPCRIVASFALVTCCLCLDAAAQSPNTNHLKVAAVQMRSSHDLSGNVARIKQSLRDCAAQGVRVAVFPECVLSGYFADVATNLTAPEIGRAEGQLADACRELTIYAIVGTPYREGNKLFNSATVISPDGRIVERYHKIQLAEPWPDAGDHLSVFKVDGVPCSIIICHDERYPELVRLPVIAGAKVVFYVSHEAGLHKESKIQPYRAQIQARAAENNVFIVHANAPANSDATGSHGQSRIIAPDGNIFREASIFEEEVVIADLDLNRATRERALRSFTEGPLQDWWREGVKHVRFVE